jgi:4-hydroxy-3-methylbut-2-enyl diphosphate reductase
LRPADNAPVGVLNRPLRDGGVQAQPYEPPKVQTDDTYRLALLDIQQVLHKVLTETDKPRLSDEVTPDISRERFLELAPDDPDRLAFITQTTLSVDDTADIVVALKARFPAIIGPHKEDICYATTNRQEAVKRLAEAADLVLVVGSPNSSNSVRLVEVALEVGARAAYRIDYASEVKQEWFDGVETLGISSGASVPEHLVDELLSDIRHAGFSHVETVTTATEDLMFSLPKELRGESDRPLGGRRSDD